MTTASFARKLMSSAALSVAVALLWMSSAEAAPDGFVDEELLPSPLTFATDMAWTPQDQMIVTLKEGLVYVYEDAAGSEPYSYDTRTLALDIVAITCINNERGLGGVQVHPNFTENRFIFLYYTFSKHGSCEEDEILGPVNRLSRFILKEDNTIDPESEEVFFDTPELRRNYHNGGRIEFGKDGYLYVSTGDGGLRATAQDPSTINGGILRLTAENEIPADNPFASNCVRCNVTGRADSSALKCCEIYGMGVRNPFRFAMDPNTPDGVVRFFINDVGEATWERVLEAGDALLSSAGQYTHGVQNWGWPIVEGPCLAGKTADCDASDYNGDFIAPHHFYLHQDGGAAVGSAFVPNGIWPSEYDNAYLYGEHVFGMIYLLKDSGLENCLICTPAQSRQNVTVFHEFLRVATIRFGPYKDCRKALYYTSIDFGGVMRRLYYDGDDVIVNCDDTSSPTIFSNPAPTAAPTAFQLPAEGGYPGELFPWSSGDDCPEGIDFCGMLEFCMSTDAESLADTYGYRLPCLGEDCDCLGISGPLIRLEPGNKYRLTLRNAAPEEVITNLHTHGLHIVGAGDSDDVTRTLSGGGNCLDYTWDIPTNHPGGTHWYHAHHHGVSFAQVDGGAFGLLIVEDNMYVNPTTPNWAANDRLLQVAVTSKSGTVGNGKKNEVIDTDAGQWFRLRVSIVAAFAEPKNLAFVNASSCGVHKVASDGIWRSSVPGPNKKEFELTGASRADFVIRCLNENSLVPIFYGDDLAATIRVGSQASNAFVMTQWAPERPDFLPDLFLMDVKPENTFSITLGFDYVNDLKWDPATPMSTIPFNQVHEWTLHQTSRHPFHIHLYHVQILTPGGCGPHEQGEYYDTIAAPENCTVRFFTADIGQRCVLHCHVLQHEDAGSMSWVEVTGENMPRNDVESLEYSCAAVVSPPKPTSQDPSGPPSSPTPSSCSVVVNWLSLLMAAALGVQLVLL